MNKKNRILLIIVFLIFIFSGAYFLNKNWERTKTKAEPQVPVVETVDPYNATYIIENQGIKLTSGRADDVLVPGSNTRTYNAIYRIPVFGDLNGDKIEDAAFFLTQDSGGSGSFYYVAVAVSMASGTEGTNAVFIGDRIYPENIEIKDKKIVVTYFDRKSDEPMSATPTQTVTINLYLDDDILKKETLTVNSFEECVAAGNPVMESYPRQCKQGDKTFTEVIKENSKSDQIQIESPLPNATICSPLVIKGKARGSWFFEASFPVVLTDWDGKIIAQGKANAKGDWMTTEFVSFEAKLEFSVAKEIYSNKGLLILRKDNPSGLPKNDDAYELPIVYASGN